MTALPTKLPQWYTVKANEEKGWVPETTDIVEYTNSSQNNNEVLKAWEGDIPLSNSKNPTVSIGNLKPISPIQVGGNFFAEGGILPAQLGGVPCIPGSSIRGALLSWIKQNWSKFNKDERKFWQSLIQEDKSGWKPRKIRFEAVDVQDQIKPFPLHAQQKWQLFNQKSNQLSVQWQVEVPELATQPLPQSQSSPQLSRGATQSFSAAFARPKPPKPSNSQSISINIRLKDKLTPQQKEWLENRVKEMLKEQGIGRGTASGFGRVAEKVPETGQWVLELKGMKPCIQSHAKKDNQIGKYRWSPQVLRSLLRGYFTRLALSLHSQDDAVKLTEKIFGGPSCQGELILTSFLAKRYEDSNPPKGYANIPSKIAHETWVIPVNARWRSQNLANVDVNNFVGQLLELASHLGGLGPGWRRPPHKLSRFNGYRGSELKMQSKNLFAKANVQTSLQNLMSSLRDTIACLGRIYHLQENTTARPGQIVSIWKGSAQDGLDKIVHSDRVCSSKSPNRPGWCGDSQHRPSGYSVREYKDYCLITVFDGAMEETLRQKRFTQIYPRQN